MAPTAGTRLRFKNAQSKKVQQMKKLPSLKNRIRGLERFLSRGPRFFERVKVMRKLRQTKKCIEQVKSPFCIVINAVKRHMIKQKRRSTKSSSSCTVSR
uniref:Uncharacterized protein n=1 Tax=Hyaloperonospora arabidopsidis (strain Emoy2) TaxID=559515 RepID=M4BEF6_HYAAE